ncbi:hypothetical protein GGS21DRAFT_544015 [Xylaria nigripes]|nr:hypothetical protein GGS21DRAFT_544015 [Xylaria nigripes]
MSSKNSSAIKSKGEVQTPREPEKGTSHYEVSLKGPSSTSSRMKNADSTSNVLNSGRKNLGSIQFRTFALRTRESGTDKYKNPFSRGEIVNIPSEHLRDYIPPDPLETDTSREWNEGDELPGGGPLPFDKVTKAVISAHVTSGAGTKADPMVLFSNKEVELMKRRSRKVLEAHVAFAKHVARKLKFSHIWIRKVAHDVETKRHGTTGLFTGEVKKSQSHLTVLLGNKKDWAMVGGHIFVLVSREGGELEYMPSERMWSHSSGKGRRRVIELWKWDEGNWLKQEHMNKDYRNKPTWRRE